jgi:hypothetical protein
VLSVAPMVGAGSSTGDERVWAKVSPELRALYTTSVAAPEGGRPLSTPDDGIMIVEDA